MSTIFFKINNNLSVIKNSFWLISEKIISIFGLIFITSYVAVYIGPENFGKLSFAVSVFIIIQTISMLGTDTILFKRISKNESSGISLMLSTTLLRWIVYLFVSLIYLFYCLYYSNDTTTIIFTISVFFSYLFLTIDHYSIYFNAILNSKINVLFNVIGLIISLTLRYLIVAYGFKIIYLAIPIITTTLIPYILRVLYFHKVTPRKKINVNRKIYSSYLIKSGSSIAISNVSIAIYSKASQILLALLVSNHALGIYTVASTLAYSWLFVPQAIITSYFSKIYKLKKHDDIQKSTAELNLFILALGITYIIFIYFTGEYIIVFLYGEQYTSAIPLLLYLAIASSISSLGIVSYRYIVAFSGYSYLSKKMLFTSIFGITTSYLLILNFEVLGAIISVLLIEILSLTILNYFYNNKSVLNMHIKTLLVIFKK